MPVSAPAESRQTWLRTAALGLAVAAIGLPINHAGIYGLLVLATIVIFTGTVTTSPARWLVAGSIVISAWLALAVVDPPRVEEGHNVFLADAARAPLASELPPDVHRFLQAEFDRAYPIGNRCDPSASGCWRGQGFPDRAFAFSADGIWDPTRLSRRVSGVDFGNPVWLRLGFTNDLRYNWFPLNSDVQRLARDGRAWMGYDRWRLLMPWYVAYRFPAAFVGSELCWTGSVLWEGADHHFLHWRHATPACRTLASDDVGRQVFGVAIVPQSLSMRLEPPASVRLRHHAETALHLLALIAVTALLAGRPRRRALLPALLIGLACIVVAVDDAAFLGGFRPHDGGDDGLVYEGFGRRIALHLLNGDIAQALRGEESVFYFGAPGLRYLRALERFVFGDTNLGYLTLTLLLPLAVFALFRRFLSSQWALALSLMFVAVPAGALFGTTYFQYVKFAARGYADPAAYIVFLCGLLPIVAASAPPASHRFGPAFIGALLLALAVFLRPNIAPLAAVVVAGAAAMAQARARRRPLAGLVAGFSFVLVMPLHNWLFGGAIVLFSANAANPELLVMRPSVYAAAMFDLLRLDFGSESVARVLSHLAGYLSGPSELPLLAPLHAAALVVLLHVAARGRGYDAWLRVIALATLVQHGVGLFYAANPRYALLTWLLTFLAVAAWLRAEGLPWLQRRAPEWSARLLRSGAARRLDGALSSLQRGVGLTTAS